MQNKERVEVDLDVVDEVARTCGMDLARASRVVKLFNDGNTLPFVARYRKEATGNLDPEQLRNVVGTINRCKEVIEKVQSAQSKLAAKGVLTDAIRTSLRKCKTVDDVEMITEPFKKPAARTLAARARAAGLDPVARAVFQFGNRVDFSRAIPNMSAKEVRNGVIKILAEDICKDFQVLQITEMMCLESKPQLVTSKPRKTPNSKDPATDKERANLKSLCNLRLPFNMVPSHKVLAINRFENRGFLQVSLEYPPQLVQRIRDTIVHRFLGTVHPAHHDLLWAAFDDGWKRLLKPTLTRRLRNKLTSQAQEVSLRVFADNVRNMLMTPPLRVSPPPAAADVNAHYCVQEKPSPDLVISCALGAPGDRLPVVGLDPGWVHGTKWAACDPLGDVLATGVIHVTVSTSRQQNTGVPELVRAMRDHGICTIALGNGQASREVENWLNQSITAGLFSPLQVRYAIVSEAGASIYSTSRLGCLELPQLDPTLRGAVSLARRLQDPLAELVKVEARHLGVGMYQHDLPERRLQNVLTETLEECISFVGVDVNAAPLHVLERVAGLSRPKAKAIIEYRRLNGRFRSRMELYKVPGIGPVTFEQCAGFLRIKPEFAVTKMNASRDVEFISLCSDDDEAKSDSDMEVEVVSYGKRRRCPEKMDTSPPYPPRKLARTEALTFLPSDLSFKPLDQTAIHPSSYPVATALVKHLKFEVSDVGCMALRNSAKALFASPRRDAVLAKFTTEKYGLETLRDILDALCRPLDFDERENRFGPMFRSSVASMANLRWGLEVMGRVDNVTTFGAFVDIGVGEEALIPISAFPRRRPVTSATAAASTPIGGVLVGSVGGAVESLSLHLGDRIKAQIEWVCPKTRKITLKNVRLL